MKRFLTALIILNICLTASLIKAEEARYITLATTTSTENSGLLAYLHPEFTRDTGIDVRVIPRGTGAALKLAENGDCDVVMVHSRSKEEAFVKNGYGSHRYDLMHNDFVLLGPAIDPAGAKGKSIAEALKLIDKTGSRFFSRGDNSGTHNKEEILWKQAMVNPGDYLMSVGQGMGKTLIMTNEKQAYTLSDRGTWLSMKDKLELVIISEGSEILANPYSVIPVNSDKHNHVKTDLVNQYIEWLTGAKGQNLINSYRKNGEQLFYADVLK